MLFREGSDFLTPSRFDQVTEVTVMTPRQTARQAGRHAQVFFWSGAAEDGHDHGHLVNSTGGQKNEIPLE